MSSTAFCMNEVERVSVPKVLKGRVKGKRWKRRAEQGR